MEKTTYFFVNIYLFQTKIYHSILFMAHLFHQSSLCDLSNSSPLYFSDSSLQVYSRVNYQYSFQIVLNENFFEACRSFWKIYFFPVLLLMIYTLTQRKVYFSCPQPEFKAKHLMLLREK